MRFATREFRESSKCSEGGGESDKTEKTKPTMKINRPTCSYQQMVEALLRKERLQASSLHTNSMLLRTVPAPLGCSCFSCNRWPCNQWFLLAVASPLSCSCGQPLLRDAGPHQVAPCALLLLLPLALQPVVSSELSKPCCPDHIDLCELKLKTSVLKLGPQRSDLWLEIFELKLTAQRS